MRVRVPRRRGVSARSQKRTISADEADSAEHRTLDAPRAMEVGAGPGEPTPASPAIVRPALVLPAVVNDTFPTAGADLPPRAARSHPRPTAARQQPLPLIWTPCSARHRRHLAAAIAHRHLQVRSPPAPLPGTSAPAGGACGQRLSPPIRLAVGSLRSRPLSAHLTRSQEPQQWVPRRTASTTHQDAGFLVAQTHRLRALSKALSEKDSGACENSIFEFISIFSSFREKCFCSVFEAVCISKKCSLRRFRICKPICKWSKWSTFVPVDPR